MKPLMIGKARQPKYLNKANPDTHLSSTEVKFLPPNTTSFTQPIESGNNTSYQAKIKKEAGRFQINL